MRIRIIEVWKAKKLDHIEVEEWVDDAWVVWTDGNTIMRFKDIPALQQFLGFPDARVCSMEVEI